VFEKAYLSVYNRSFCRAGFMGASLPKAQQETHAQEHAEVKAQEEGVYRDPRRDEKPAALVTTDLE
jgi:hypothetical protein